MSHKGTQAGVSLEKLKSEYDGLIPDLTRFTEELVKQLHALVHAKKIRLAVPIEFRVKSWGSVQSKIEKHALRLTSVTEIQDLVGIRLIVLFRRDAAKLCDVVAKTFKIIQRKDASEHLKEDQFGYSSVHFLIGLPEEWLSVPSLSSIGKFRAELQVRTVSQHTWAAASHVLQYKQEDSVPLPVRRSIHRVSALLEMVDLEFERVLSEREKYRDELDFSKAEPLNADSLEKLLDSLLPAQNKQEGENYSVLLAELSDFEIRTVQQLRRIIAEHIDVAMKEEEKMVREPEKALAPQRKRVVEKGVFFTHVGLVRMAMAAEFGDRWKLYMDELALKYLPKDHPLRQQWERETAELRQRLQESR